MVGSIAVVVPLKNELQFARDVARVKREIVEVRADFAGRRELSEQTTKLLSKIAHRSILTIRPQWEGGNFRGDENLRVGMLKSIGEEIEPRFVDVEHKVAHKFKESSFRKIVSWHDFNSTPPFEELLKKYKEMEKLGDIVKIATTAKNAIDIVNVMKLYSRAEKGRLIAFAMGEIGKISRVLSVTDIYGAPFAYSSLGAPVAPGQYGRAELQKILEKLSRD
ncbi:MAG: type I 3-dehydroquinate dehydratase [Candidatus Micrarchaeota archaeon]|nr:type I 3-dehydroquinate dehydratase [Candidatus Micrarchaeota archaeon]